VSMNTLFLAIGAVLAAGILAAALPRVLLRRAQDRLAARLLSESGFRLLTRAELVVGKYRRAPGVLGLSREAVSFQGLFGESEVLPTLRIQKVVTGRRLSSGRKLLRLQVLRLTRTIGGELEFVLTPASASAWRSHLGLWAVAERQGSIDRVAPGR
jgi:hypothetical protein